MEASEVESCETIVTATWSIEPSLQLTFLLNLLFLFVDETVFSLTTSTIRIGTCLIRLVRQNELDENLTCFLDVFVRGVMNRRISTLVIDIEDIELVFCCIQVILELAEVHSLNELKDELLLPTLL